jgi:kumamolisin
MGKERITMKQLKRLAFTMAALTLALPVVALGLQQRPPAAEVGASLAATAHPRDLFQTLLANSQDLGPVAPARPVSFILLLRDPTAAREEADLAALYDPRSPHYGHFLTAAQYAATYGPPAAAVAQVRAILRRDGLAIQWQKGDTWLVVSGPAGRVERIFRVHIHDYIAPTGEHFYASAQDPRIPVALRPEVSGASHVSSYLGAHRLSVPVGGLYPVDLLAAYDIQKLRDQGIDGRGQTVVFWETDAFVQSDLDAFTRKMNLPPLHPIVRGDRLAKVEGEANMDLQVVHEIAPMATLIVYNLDWSKYPELETQFEFQRRMITENRGAVFSISTGPAACDRLWGSLSQNWERTYDQADSLGESVFASSGDSGAYSCLNPPTKRGTLPSEQYLGIGYPQAAPGVTAVGGTRLSVLQQGGWYDETVWEDPLETEGTGGGLSAYHSRPAWQRGPGVQNQYSNGKREVPDVSADADTASGVAVYQGGRLEPGNGGTSLSAPIWAGMTALIDEYLKKQGVHPIGFMNPALYTLAATHQPYPPFHDVTVGDNLYYPATPGYDLATGLGTPDAWNLARDLVRYQTIAALGSLPWSPQTSNTTNNLYNVACPSPSTCFAVGGSGNPFLGAIRRTTDGGTTWSSQTSGTTIDLFRVACPSPSTCFAVGGRGTILRTTNGGST